MILYIPNHHQRLCRLEAFVHLILAALLTASTLTAQPHAQTHVAQTSTVLMGSVRNTNNTPVNFASVMILETKEGRLTDKHGTFTLPTSTHGTVMLRVKHGSYEPFEQVLVIKEDTKQDTKQDTVRLEVVLYPKLVTLKAAVVGASAFSSSDDIKTVTMRPLDVATTPGAAADIFRALQTFPGVANVDDGSTLIVRGGDASETVSLLDQATIARPYRFETPTGGAFGTIPPFFVSGMMFTSGGFPARYGNAMSAVLAMESQNIPTNNQLRLNAGIFGASVGADVAVVPDRVGLRFSGNRSDAKLLFLLNGTDGEFPRLPRGYDLNLSLTWKYSSTGKFKLFHYLTNDDVAVWVRRPRSASQPVGATNDDVFSNNATNRIHSLQWTELFGNSWLVKTSLSWNNFHTRKEVSNVRITPVEDNTKLRVDVEKDLDENLRVLFGTEAERDAYVSNITRLGQSAPQEEFQQTNAVLRVGGYAETEAKLGRAWLVSAGVRADYHRVEGVRSERLAIDPRLSVRYALAECWNLRASWGVYSQFANAYSYHPVAGNAALRPQSAEHHILSIDYQEDQWMVRVEAYNKLYRGLVLASAATTLDNLGAGYARGVDVFMKYGAYLVTPTSGWVSYSYLQARRTQTLVNHGEQVYEDAPSPFDLTHNLTVVFKQQIASGFVSAADNLAAGFTARYGTGAPITPIVGGERQADGSYLPIYGGIGSERLADNVRLDVNASYYTPFEAFGTVGTLVVFASVNNVTNTLRAIAVDYSRDYSQRVERLSLSRRTFVAGLVATLQL